MKRKLEMLTKASNDTTEQKIKLEMEITRLESETLEERKKRAKAHMSLKRRFPMKIIQAKARTQMRS